MLRVRVTPGSPIFFIIANQRSVLMRGLRDYGGALDEAKRAELTDAVSRLARILRRVEHADTSSDAMRGSEGEAASVYFSVFDHLIRVPEPDMRWKRRSRRPPLDAIKRCCRSSTRSSPMTAAAASPAVERGVDARVTLGSDGARYRQPLGDAFAFRAADGRFRMGSVKRGAAGGSVLL